MRLPASPGVRPTADGVHPIAALAPLDLDAAEVARVGIVRAAFDAVHEDARVDALKAAARSESQDAYVAALAASANLARRTATAYLQRSRRDAPPPF